MELKELIDRAHLVNKRCLAFGDEITGYIFNHHLTVDEMRMLNDARICCQSAADEVMVANQHLEKVV